MKIKVVDPRTGKTVTPGRLAGKVRRNPRTAYVAVKHIRQAR